MPSSRGSSQPRDQTHISCISCFGRQVLYHQRHLGSPREVMCITNWRREVLKIWALKIKHFGDRFSFMDTKGIERCENQSLTMEQGLCRRKEHKIFIEQLVPEQKANQSLIKQLAIVPSCSTGNSCILAMEEIRIIYRLISFHFLLLREAQGKVPYQEVH